MREIHARSRVTYGALRVHAELRLGLDLQVGCKRIARLMREHGMQGVHGRRRAGLTRRDPAATPAPAPGRAPVPPCGSSTLTWSVRRLGRLSLLGVVGRRRLLQVVGGRGPTGQQIQGVL